MEVFYRQNSFSILIEQLLSSPRDVAAMPLRPDASRGGQITEQLLVSIVPGLASFLSASITFLTSVCLCFEYSDLEPLRPNQAG